MGQTAFGQRAVDHICSAFHQTPLIRILDAQNKGASPGAGDQPGVQRRAQVAHVHIAGRGGGKAGAYLSVGDLVLHLGKIVPVHRHSKLLRIIENLPIHYIVFPEKVNDDLRIPLIFCSERDRMEHAKENADRLSAVM